MRVEFTCTEDDFREANGLPPGRSSRGAKGFLSIVRKVIPAVIISGSLTFTMFLVFSSTTASQPTWPAGRTLFLRFAAASAISIAFLAFWIWALGRSLIRAPRRPWDSPLHLRPGSRRLRNFLIGGAIGTLIIWVPAHTSIPSLIKPTAYEVMLSVIPGAAFLIIMIIFSVAHRQATVRRSWASQPLLHRPLSVEMDESGMSVTELTASHRYQWAHFGGYRETPNLMLVYISSFMFWIIPKRSFTPEELQALKASLSTHVAHGSFLPVSGRFAVLPVGAATSVVRENVVS